MTTPLLTDTEHAAVLQAVEQLASRPGNLLEVLHAVQARLGFVPAAAVPVVAAELNLSRAEVQGVLSFYHYFRQQPPGQHTVRVCRAEACQAMGGESLAQHVQQRLGVGFGETTQDGRFTLEAVYCLGLCACAPSLQMNDVPQGRVTTQRFDELLAALALPA
jgi:formate dehydrogenase subunit gamma